ncbi:MAG TPA: FHA domain-containing protein [Stackebrandtia sp.]|jgi:hypothetical protein|uniref:FHA domain-containing protein n=1 Tax=Stackebrandtia sp. TaxID=2023065 RepID=UPI002D2F4310|nr:FHA domain-containing protein [Stackebrandtia sp.]HZE41523.1 FHA domain-containing protein [Stackebrandtia sp.]
MGHNKVKLLPQGIGGLAHQLPPEPPGTLFVLGENQGMSVGPDSGFRVTFGRDAENVHIVVGAGDKLISRVHGYIERHGEQWVMYNEGRRPIRFPRSPLLLADGWTVLPQGYSPLFVVCDEREHLLEVRVVTAPSPGASDRYADKTVEARKWDLGAEERLAVVCVAQRYLINDPFAQPLAWVQAAAQLKGIHPNGAWESRKVERVVTKVRDRLSSRGVPGLTRAEVGEPVGNTLNHNLITELLATTSIMPSDLHLLEDPAS